MGQVLDKQTRWKMHGDTKIYKFSSMESREVKNNQSYIF